jgi:dihydrofolate synthase/folylpolyglutamate synthase
MKTYLQVIDVLEKRGVMPLRAPSLHSTEEGLKRIGFFEFAFTKALTQDQGATKCIIVAGTNGKGSVCATLEALLISAGERTGLYTSPHLVEYTERYRISGQDVSRELFCQAFEAVDRVTEDLALSHFETLTLMGVWIFCSGEAIASVDRLILEVGLGGLWDATNAVPHGLCVITRLGLDHQNFLGNSLESVAQNKFGVVSQGSRVVHAPLAEELLPLRAQVESKTQSHWTEARIHPYEIEKTELGPKYFLKTSWGLAELGLAGPRAVENSSIALSAFEALRFDPARHLSALAKVRWPGRMERVETAFGVIYFSGDHNPQGVESLFEFLHLYPRKHLHVLLGVGKDKDLSKIIEPFLALADTSVYLTQTPFRGRTLSEYAPYHEKVRGAHSHPIAALNEIFRLADPDDMILVTGSLYLVGALKRQIMQQL